MTLATLEPTKTQVKLKDDPLMSFIVPIYDLPAMTLKRCLLSLTDQDYENLEIICVLDGPNEELKRIAESFISRQSRENLKVVEIPHSGACAARNAGFRESKGEIVSFFNSDYIAKPGMARMWVDVLQNNPDCGFAYGGYEYATSQRHVFPSGSYDPFLLDIENYIDCGFPLWRKYVVNWDENCKSLQDWDFWLRVIKTHKVKGFFLSDYSFIAEAPRPSGLSMDSSSNWNERVNYIKQKNQIPLKDILVTSIGAENHGLQIAKLMDADYRKHTWHKTDWISEYKALYMIGFYIRPNEAGLNEHARRLALFKEKNPKAKRIVHFVGADIYWLRKFPWESLNYLVGALKQSCDAIFSENQAAHDELLKFGLSTQIVPIPSYQKWEVKPLPKEFKVGIYLVEPGGGEGQSDFDKYCYEGMLSIVRGMPDVQFTGYGKGGWDLRYPNLKIYKSIPREKWADYVYENSCLLRIARHDTKPLASNEFMLAGRDVISNIKDECTDYIDTSGKEDLNSWDKFNEGLNVYNWPKTKKEIILKIREVKKRAIDLQERQKRHESLVLMQDQEAYKNKIKELCNV